MVWSYEDSVFILVARYKLWHNYCIEVQEWFSFAYKHVIFFKKLHDSIFLKYIIILIFGNFMFSAKWYMDSAILHACHASHCRWGQAKFLLLNWDLTAWWIISIHFRHFLVVDYKFSMSWHLGRFMHISCVNFHAYIGKWHCCPSEQEIKMFLQIELFASVVRALAFFDRPAAAWTVLRSVLLNVRT